MKCKLISYEHSENGLSLFIVPETEAERELLCGMWRHGEMKMCNGIADESGRGFCVAWKFSRHQ